MRIFMVTSAHWPPREGIGRFVFSLCDSLERRGHDLTVFVKTLKEPSRPTEPGGPRKVVQSAFIPFPPFHVDSHGLFLKHAITNQVPRPDIIHYHSPLVPSVKTGIPSIVTVHSPMKAGVSGMEHSNLGYATSNAVLHTVSLRTERRLFQDARRVVCVSSKVKDELNREPYYVSRDRMSVVTNGVDYDFYSPDLESADSRVVFWAGRLAGGKGIDDLLECVRLVSDSCKDVRFRIAGEGPMKSHIRRSIDRSGLQDFVEILGWLPRQRMLEEYRKAGIFLMTSHYEGMPTVLLEAMACSMACVATNIGDIPDLIDSGANGFIVPVGDAHSMADRLVDLIRNPDKSRAVGVNARNTVISKASWSQITAQYERLYSEVLDGETEP